MNKQELDRALQSLREIAQSNLFHADFDGRVQGAYINVLKNLNYILFDKALNEVLTEVKFFPKPYEIVKAYNKISSEQKTEIHYYTNCPLCENRGIYMYRKEFNKTVYEYAARCICNRGNKYSGAPLISDKVDFDSLKEEAEQKSVTIQRLLNTRLYSDSVPVYGVEDKPKPKTELQYKISALASKMGV